MSGCGCGLVGGVSGGEDSYSCVRLCVFWFLWVWRQAIAQAATNFQAKRGTGKLCDQQNRASLETANDNQQGSERQHRRRHASLHYQPPQNNKSTTHNHLSARAVQRNIYHPHHTHSSYTIPITTCPTINHTHTLPFLTLTQTSVPKTRGRAHCCCCC